MIKKKLLQKSNKLTVVIIVVALLLAATIIINIYNNKMSIQRKLIGLWNIEFENSIIANRELNSFDGIIYISNKVTIELPSLCCDKPVKIAQAESTGIWQTISKNPDSVFFNVPKNPLHGKYAIRFFIDENGYLNMKNNIYKMELSNDSTYLICNKAGIMHLNSVRDWEGKN